MADTIKAIFVAKKITPSGDNPDGTQWRRADVNLVKRGTLTALEPNGHTPGRARKFDTADGEVYDEVLFFDVWPDTWPQIGNVNG
jgi:hypothetical protein